MLASHAAHGQGKKAMELLNEMIENNVELNDQSFTSILAAYSHSGMIAEARELFEKIKSPLDFHIGAMIDVYSRAGLFEEALLLIGERKNFVMWNTVMGACRKFNNVEVGEKVFKILTTIDENHASPYLLLFNIYNYNGLNEKVEQLRQEMEKKGIKKVAGIVFHEEDGKTYKFISGSDEHETDNKIVEMREEIYLRILKEGFRPDTKCVSNSKLLSEKEKIDSLQKHAEKTAIVHAFVLNENRKTIILRSSLRICNDCHNAIQFISKVMKVEIIIRDAHRHHHFKDGKCNCDGYW